MCVLIIDSIVDVKSVVVLHIYREGRSEPVTIRIRAKSVV
jgi:hypothetical protein